MEKRDLEGFINIRTRWINIFQPYEQRKLVSTITSHYNFSPRLTSVITTPPAAAAKLASASANSSAPGLTERHAGKLRNWRGGSSGHSGNSRDVENGGLQVPAGSTTGVEMQQMHSRTAGRRGMGASAEVGNYMDLAQKLWHWHAVEWGNECRPL